MKRLYLGDRLNIRWPLVLVAMWLGLLTMPTWERLYDKHIRPRPMISASIVVYPVEGDAKPVIAYSVEATTDLEGVWRAWVEIERSQGWFRLAPQGAGTSSYGPNRPDTLIVGWDWFFERDMPVPRVPFRVCVSYALRTVETGVTSSPPPYCSDVVTP